MLVRNGEGVPHCVSSGNAQGIVELAGATVLTKSDTYKNASPIRAELTGTDTCSTLGITAAPPLALCRELIAAGVDPDTALHVYRQGVLALRIRSIGAGAKLTVRDDGYGRPQLRRWDGRETRAEASLVRKSGIGGGSP